MRRVVSVVLASTLLAAFAGVGVLVQAEAPANEYFQRTWERTDRPVADGVVSRTWMWGPEAFTGEMQEEYAQSPGGQRTVQYFDKARMEITHPEDDPGSIWYVTNGLLSVELITGQMQVGDTEFAEHAPAEVNVAGDADDPNGPTYASFSGLLDVSPAPSNSLISTQIDRDGNVSDFPAAAGYGVTVARIDGVTSHAIAAPFWDFMTSSAVVYQNGDYVEDSLFETPYFATGRPITEAYWATVLVGGEPTDVLMQCFERRCLTYTPGNDPGWQVEAGNIGQHYYRWRYGDSEQPSPQPTPPAACEPGSGPDYSGENLLSQSFVGEDLQCADFSDAHLAQPNFTDANLTRARFDGGRLSQPVFTNTNLAESSFIDTHISQGSFEGTVAVDADFSDATLSQPTFNGADLTGANLSTATIVGATFIDTTCPDGTNSDNNGGSCPST